MDLSNLLEVFLALCQANSGWNLTNILKLVDWLKALNQVKGFNAMTSLCLWQRFISQRTVQVFTNEMPFESLSTSAIRSLQTFCCPGLSQMRGNKTKRQKRRMPLEGVLLAVSPWKGIELTFQNEWNFCRTIQTNIRMINLQQEFG